MSTGHPRWFYLATFTGGGAVTFYADTTPLALDHARTLARDFSRSGVEVVRRLKHSKDVTPSEHAAAGSLVPSQEYLSMISYSDYLRPRRVGVRPKTTWRTAADVPRRQRGLFLARANRNQQPCEHGHLSCSDRADGPCSDELLQLIEAEHEKEAKTETTHHKNGSDD